MRDTDDLLGIFHLDVADWKTSTCPINEPTADEPSANNTHETNQDGGGSAGPNIHLYITEQWGEGMGAREMYEEREAS